MVKIRDLLDSREMEMMEHYQKRLVNLDIEDTERISMYQNLMAEMIQKARNRYYKENPTIIPLNKDGNENQYSQTVRSLLTDDEAAEVDFLKWRLIKSIFPWTKRRYQRKIESILSEAKDRT